MRKALIYIVFILVSAFCFDAAAQTGAFLRQLQQRDSILVGDQLEYGFRLEGVEDGTLIGYPELQEGKVELIENWNEKVVGRKVQGVNMPDLIDLEASIRIAAFDEGNYALPPIVIGVAYPSGELDTLTFGPMQMEVKSLPVDIETFERHDMKDMIQTPFTWDEFVYTVCEIFDVMLGLYPWLLLGKWIIILVIAGLCIWMMYERQGDESYVVRREPAHIVALRKLDSYRSNAMWVPEKQKSFYTGVTDALREYISRRYGIGAMEMTTAELFKEMKNIKDIPADQLNEVHDLFERADFVKFAKYLASDEDNASSVPVAVRFVTQTYQSELEMEQAKENADEKKN